MKKKYSISVIMITIFLSSVAQGFCQDTSKFQPEKKVQYKPGKPSVIDSNRGNPATDKPHADIKSNSGTSIPSTTSGTLGSSVNPNTQFVIPLHKSKKKSNSNPTPDSGLIIPKK